jgi:hypothetical protein
MASALGTAVLGASIDSALRLGLDVIDWRYRCLERAGFSVEEAILLAERGDVDLHAAVALLERGASAEQALRILL